ncbi:GmrSD restriction endonuclease domain-containing protein [Actinoplanes sp. URMC 104]|uniref:GmrSD restriction endonuclease domain-containing protein n=1 Tax=Actinoplanes sp. URMC 104 TaxID=3423409 RepID=UPI003F1DF17B
MSKLATILDQIDSGTMLLPEFQRGYVWNRDQVRGLMRSLYLGYPVGALLVWETETDPGSVRGTGQVGAGVKLLLLDGQQRITSLYGVVRGRPPAFFEGEAATFTGLRFNVDEQTFEFHAPAKMNGDQRWVDVTGLFVEGLAPQITALSADPVTAPHLAVYVERLSKLHNILQREFHQEKITGHDMGVDAVVEIFNRVNSGGTKLSKGDLALAKICAEWPEARATMRKYLQTWDKAGFQFNLDWLLRNVNAVATGRAQFDALENVAPDEFAGALRDSTKHVSGFLDAVSGRLGLDHNRVLMGRYAIPVVSRFLHLNGGGFRDAAERDRMLYWYVQAALWGRFAGSTETVLTQDYETLNRGSVDGLIASLTRWRGGNLTIDGQDFEGFGRGSRFYPLLYLLTRVLDARDLGTGLPLKSEMLGHLTSLQVHHIFPKALLYKQGYRRAEVNAVANFCFLTQQTNLKIGKRSPEEYFAEVEAKQPGALASQWIPLERDLWKPENYLDFLSARRELLASAANGFLAKLRDGAAPTTEPLMRMAAVDEEDIDERTQQVEKLVAELTKLGCAEPELDVEITDPVSRRPLIIAEALWPDGLQPGLGEPVVLELDEGGALSRLNELGYQVFTSVDALRQFVLRRNAQSAGVVPTTGESGLIAA